MQDPTTLIAVASTAVAGVGITSAAALKGWQDWLDVRRLQVGAAAHEPSPAGSRIEVADLKERVRKLEAIATGIDF